MSKESRQRLRQTRVEQSWRDLYEKHKEHHLVEMHYEEERIATKLRDPVFAKSLGLPENLPEHTIAILKKTMTMDKFAPKMPKVNKYCDALGNAPTVLHNLGGDWEQNRHVIRE